MHRNSFHDDLNSPGRTTAFTQQSALQVDARLRIVAALVLIAVIGFTPPEFLSLGDPPWMSVVHGMAMAIVVGVLIITRVPAAFLWRRLRVLIAPLALMTIFLPIVHGAGQGGRLAVLIVVKATLSFLIIVALTYATPTGTLLTAARRLRVPHVLVTSFASMHRYLDVLREETDRMTRARQARTFHHRSGVRALQWRLSASLVGVLLVRSTERAERIHAAMKARGYDGRWRSLDEV